MIRRIICYMNTWVIQKLIDYTVVFTWFLLQLSQNAVADYNRARTYLADLANRDRVPVFENVAEAVNCAVQRLTTEYGNISTNSLL